MVAAQLAIDQRVWVKLTSYGLEILERNFCNYKRPTMQEMAKKYRNEQGYYEFEFYEFAQIFGRYCTKKSNGRPYKQLFEEDAIFTAPPC